MAKCMASSLGSFCIGRRPPILAFRLFSLSAKTNQKLSESKGYDDVEYTDPTKILCINSQDHYKRIRITGLDATEGSLHQEFRVLELYPKKQSARVARQRITKSKPPTTSRESVLPIDGSWMNVWPTAQSFRASVVPLPIRMGYTERDAPPAKHGNAELMKIPNFLHLTPPAIRKHCEAIKKFCTQWPAGLQTEEAIERHFPITVTFNDYCFSGPSIRNPAARVVTLQVQLSSLDLNEHAKDKLLRLVGERYDLQTDILTLTVDRCPMRKQNYDYVKYLLTALFHESWKIESWENEKEESDMEQYIWEGSQSQINLIRIIRAAKEAETAGAEPTPITSALKTEMSDGDIVHLEAVVDYGSSVAKIHNDGEDEKTICAYKETVKRLLNLNTKVKVIETSGSS